MGITRTVVVELVAATHSLFNSSTVPTPGISSADSTLATSSISSLIPTLTTSSISSITPTLTTLNTSASTITSSPANLPFSFIIPYNQSQECNIYGPICQTGLITVGVDLSSTTTTTTLPCSSYLTAQSSYLHGFQPFPDAIKPFYPLDWKTGFGRSPECKSYAQAWEKRGEGGKFTFSNCGSNNAIVPASEGVNLQSQIPPGVLNQIPFQVYECCGNCSVDAQEVRLYYFPDESASTSCSKNTLDLSQNATGPAGKQPQRLPAADSIAILSGYTFTSPSAYLEIVGTAAVRDQCDTVGAVLTNPIIALPPGQISTYSPQFPFTIGETYYDPNGVIGGQFLGHVNPLKTADLACPTFGLGLSTSDGVTYTTYGPPFLPIIIPPPQLLDLDPEWKRLCTGFLSNSPGLRSFAIFDPPRILTPVAGLFPPSPPVPAGTPAIETPISRPPPKPPAQPAQITLPRIPKATADPNPPDPALSKPKAPPAGSQKPSPAQPKIPVPDLGQPSPKPVDPTDIERPATSPPKLPNQESDPEKRSSKLGPIILSAFGEGDPQDESPKPAPPANIAPTPVNGQPAPPIKDSGVVPEDNVPPVPFIPKFITAAGQTFEANPAAISIAGATLLPGGEGITISGTPIRLAPSGTLLVGNSPIPIPSAPPIENSGVVPVDNVPPVPFTLKIVTAAGQTFEANPAAISIAGTTLLPGGEGITISGTPIRLAPSGTLLVGNSPIPIPPTTPKSAPTPPEPAAVFTIADQTFTANPTGFTIAGTSVEAGGVPVTISGTPVALDNSGGLVIGASSFQIPNQNAASVFTVGNQPFTAKPSGFVVAGSTVLPGGVPVTISGTSVALDNSGGLVVGTSSFQIPNQDAASVFTVGNQPFTANPSGFVIADSTVLPGGAPVTISGTQVALNQAGGLVIGSSTIKLPLQTPIANTLTFGGFTITAGPSASSIVVDGATLVAGSAGTTISGTPISLNTGGNLVVGSKTINLAAQTPPPNTFSVGGLTFTAAPSASAVAIDGTTFVPGGPGATISGTSISLQPNGELLVGSQTISIPIHPANSNTFTVGSFTFTASPTASAIAIDGTTLLPGGPGTTISGTTISLQPNGKLLVGSETLNPFQSPSPHVFTTNGLTFTSDSSEILVDGTTLLPGGPRATIHGTPVSVAPGGSLVVGSSTVSAQAFEGRAGRVGIERLGMRGVVLGAVAVGLMFA